MNVRWMWFDFIDPDLPLTSAQRKSVRRQARFLYTLGEFSRKTSTADLHAMEPLRSNVDWSKRWPIVLYMMGVLPLLLLVFKTTPLITFVLWAIALALVVWLVMVIIEYIRCRSLTFMALRMHGVEVCRRCGYWLRGLGDDVNKCPECGTLREAMPERSPAVQESDA